MAKFWVALGADVVRENGRLKMTMSPHEALLGTEDFARWNAMQG